MGAKSRVTKDGLTVMRKKFCAEYVADPEFNATAAAIRAGFSEKSAKVKASQMLDLPEVQKEIERLTNAALLKQGITALGVTSEIKKLAYSNVMDFGRVQEGHFIVDLSQTTRDQMAAVSEITTDEWTEGKGENKTTHRRTKLKLAAKTPNLELLSRRFNLFPEKRELSGPGGGPVHFTLERIGGDKKKV